jgi:hypothetical protein
MVPMELLQNIYAVLSIILLLLVFLAVLVVACLPENDVKRSYRDFAGCSSREWLAQRCAKKTAGLQQAQLPPGNRFAPPDGNPAAAEESDSLGFAVWFRFRSIVLR